VADISKCNGERCPIRDACHRYTAIASPFWQSYGNFTFNTETNSCEDFWDNEGYIKEKDNGRKNP
jgi:hypothetical protein